MNAVKTYRSKNGKWNYLFRWDGKVFGDIGFATEREAFIQGNVHLHNVKLYS